MKWALVTTESKDMLIESWISSEKDDGEGGTYTHYTPDIQTVNKPAGTICEVIVYDGVSQYTPPANLELKQVPDSAKRGDEGYGS